VIRNFDNLDKPLRGWTNGCRLNLLGSPTPLGRIASAVMPCAALFVLDPHAVNLPARFLLHAADLPVFHVTGDVDSLNLGIIRFPVISCAL
jgi:hypothetical protein